MNPPPDEARDREIARALERITLPDYEPGFWARLEERLESEPAPQAIPRVSPPSSGSDRELGDDPQDLVVVPLARRARVTAGRRRGMAVLAAAAAIVIAVIAVRLVTDDGTPVQTASDPHTSTTAPGSTPAGNRVTGALHEAGSTSTPQDAFVTWVTALRSGEAQTASALIGPRTVRYYEALGSGLDHAGDGWELWAATEGRTIEVIDFGEVEGEHVAALVLSRPSDLATDGVAHDAIPMVEGESGWVVEPAAFDTQQDSRLEIVSPGQDESGLTALPVGAPVEVQVSGAGVYYVGADDLTLAGFVPADAHDGRISWTPPKPLRPGSHLLLVAHLSPRVLTIQAVPFPVA